MNNNKIINVCEKCEKEDIELFSHINMKERHFVEWICEECFEALEGCKFKEFSKEHLYGGE